MRMIHQLTTLAAALVAVTACTKTDSDRGIGQWFFTVDTVRSDIDDSVRYQVVLQLFGREGPEGLQRDQVVRLRTNCDGSVILTDHQLEQGSYTLRIRLDSFPAYTIEGFGGSPTGMGMIMIRPLNPFLDSLRGNSRALIEYSVGASRIVAEFAIAGLDTLIPRFLAACAVR